MPASVYAKNLYANYATSADMYLALCYSSPSPTDDGSSLLEVSGTGYSRVTLTSANWSAAASGVCTYNASHTLNPGSDWGVISYYAVCDAATGGNLIAFGPLAATFEANNGSAVKIQSGTLTIGAQ